MAARRLVGRPGHEYALEFGPAAVLLSFGDPTPFPQPIRRAGALLMIQVTDLTEARQALDAGADVIVVQGTESGAVPPAVWAGEAVDLIGDLPSAEDLVTALAAEAEQALDRVRSGAA